MNKAGDLIPPHGGYRRLRSFAVALAAYDGTVVFCKRFIDVRSRTHDQMLQAARSGVQNIAEGSLASGTSKKTELKLTNVARASLGELIRDYEDYLRQHRLPIWDKESPRVRGMRARLAGKLKRAGAPDDGGWQPGLRSGQSSQSGRSGLADGVSLADVDRGAFFDEPLLSALTALETAPAEVGANILLCLSHQASYLLKCQLERLERDFLEKGGFTESLYQHRLQSRKHSKSDGPD